MQEHTKRVLVILMGLILIVSFSGYGLTFVSMPDFLNQDTLSVSQARQSRRVLKSVKNHNPDFVLVPGDLVMGRWYITPDNVKQKANKYYSQWQLRFDRYNLKYYTAVGDHELGDIPAVNYLLQGYLLPTYKQAYRDNFEYPNNGAEGLNELTYYFIKDNTLFITLYTFQVNGWFVESRIEYSQIQWLKDVLSRYRDQVKHIIVQGHSPLISVDGGNNSSKVVTKNGQEVWGILSRYNVDYYLCGEFHDLDVKEKQGTTQIVHGGLVGSTDFYYVKFHIDDSIKFTIKKVI